MIVPAVPHRTPIWHAHFKCALYTEGHHRVTRNSNCSTAAFAAANRSNNTADQTLVALGFDSLRICFDGVSLTIRDDRFQIDDEIIVRSRPDDQLNFRTPRNRQTTVVASDV